MELHPVVNEKLVTGMRDDQGCGGKRIRLQDARV
jgi:hypothetical protein